MSAFVILFSLITVCAILTIPSVVMLLIIFAMLGILTFLFLAIFKIIDTVDDIDKTISMDDYKIDGLKLKFGDSVDISVEGPDTSFKKWVKKCFTGKSEYSAKLKVGGKELGRIDTNGNIKINDLIKKIE